MSLSVCKVGQAGTVNLWMRKVLIIIIKQVNDLNRRTGDLLWLLNRMGLAYHTIRESECFNVPLHLLDTHHKTITF